MSKGISPQLEEKIKQYKTIQQKLSVIQQQIQALKNEQIDIEKALKEIDEIPDDEICYRSVGRLMVKSTIKESKVKLSDQKELSETRIKLSEKSSEKLNKQFEELEVTIKAALETGQQQ